jgi:hypothetical protein
MKHPAINFFNQFTDVKLEKRSNSFFGSMVKKESVSVHAISKDWADAIGNYRMLDNEKVKIESIKQGIIDNCIRVSACSHALLIQDTTQPNYERHRGRIKAGSGLGVIGDNKSLGYFMHPTLVMNADSGNILGISDIITWTREEGRQVKEEGKRKQEAIEEKESYRWIDSIIKSRDALTHCETLTCIADREGDIFELFAIVPDEKTQLLIRSRDNRRLAEGKLFDYLSSQPVAGIYEIEVRGDIRKKRQKRKAKIEVKIAKVTLLKPEKLKKDKKYADVVELHAIEAKEIEETVPKGEKPIHWRLLTTHQVSNFKQAVFVIYWYSLRWNIEQLFRVLQNEGLDIESSELETGTSIIKLGMFALGASLKVMQLLLASKGESTQPIEHVFTDNEIDFINDLSKKYNGKTEKQKNRNKPGTLKWASWIIARVGGWKGYESQHPAGPITFFKGLHDFYLMYEGWIVAKEIT